MAQLRKSHSNYILRRKRQLTSKGALYERDWMTVSELDGFAPGTLPVYASGNFKMTINSDRGGKKKYSFSDWLLNENGSEDWTTGSIKEESLKARNNLIKPNYTSILDFAYYGSAVELIRGTVNDIIHKYPAELYTTNNGFIYPTTEGYETLDNVVENPFSIDIFTPYVSKDTVDNPYRYMALSWDKYEIIKEDGMSCDVIGWKPGTFKGNPCFNGDIVFEGAQILFDIDCCDDVEGGDGIENLDGEAFLTEEGYIHAKIPMGNVPEGKWHKYYPALQEVFIDIHEYNNPEPKPDPENLTGSRINKDTLEIPMGNVVSGPYMYYPAMQIITRNVHEYNLSDFGAGNTELVPFIPDLEPVELDPVTGITCNIINFNGVFVNGSIYLVSDRPGYHIRLKEKYIEESFDTFDDFEHVLLNRETKPLYKSKFMTPRETDRGIVTHEVAYIWPRLSGGWNLDFLSNAYESYLNGLLYIATYYDECRSDNIWRSYTHESIKNFDWTTPRDTYIPEMDGHEIDTERVESILKVCGRQFDDLKRYIENIKFTVNVSYNSKNNMPDQNMAKFLEMNGWDVKNVSPVNDNSLVQVEEYPGKSLKFRPEDANIEFLKRMILNSRNILSKKGTRAGIEAMYSMFGIFDMKHGDKIDYDGETKTVGYTIDEYVTFTNNYISENDEEYDEIIDMNSEKSTYQKQYENTSDDFCGLMVGRVEYDGIKYLVPWYNMDDVYDGYPYYQMFGGWGHRKKKNVSVKFSKDFTVNRELVSDNGCKVDFAIYDETVKNVKVVEDFNTLNRTPIGFLAEGDIYYVLNLTEAYQIYDCEDGDYSHYVFFTGTTDFSQTVPYNEDYSWCLVQNSAFTENTLSWYAKKILYMESIHDVSIGNNPHDGNGRYDLGSEYFEYYKQIFRGALEHNLFDDYRERVAAENSRRHYDNRFRQTKLDDLPDNTVVYDLESIGFDVEGCLDQFTRDNSKVWHFLSADSGIYDNEIRNYDGRMEWSADGFPVVKKKLVPANYFINSRNDTGSTSYSDETMEDFPLEYEAKTFQNKPISDTASTITTNPETLPVPASIKSLTGEYGPDELWAYSVINTKNMTITYHLPKEMEDYVTNVVEFYVKQMIPSTVILDIKWEYV